MLVLLIIGKAREVFERMALIAKLGGQVTIGELAKNMQLLGR